MAPRAVKRRGLDTEGVSFDAGTAYRWRPMSLVANGKGRFIVRWRTMGHRHSKTFSVLADAERFEAKVVAEKQRRSAARHLINLRHQEFAEQVYVVRCGEHVKIGRSNNPVARMESLRTASPFPLSIAWLIACSSPRTVERALHRRYAEHQIRGEWFKAEPVLEDLEDLAKLGPIQLNPGGSSGIRTDYKHAAKRGPGT